jgi:TonB-dependent starch-binding outer membrane protein SusC
MKKIRIRGSGQLSLWKKCFRLMKLTFLFMMMGLMQISANVYSQTAKLTLNMRNARVIDVLEQIEKQSEFRFAYSAALIDLERRVSVNINEKNIGETLDALFAGTGVKHVTYDRHIMLYPQELDAPSINEVQQQKSISGKVTDEAGQPLPGVTLIVKGTTQGTVTNADGDYSLSSIPEYATLVFSFVGMTSKEFQVAGNQKIDVVMEEDKLAIDEVIVIGYGTARRQDYTGSVSSVKMENSPVSLLPNTNALESLKGNVPGLNIGASNTVGQEVSMLIRGQNSITGSNNPLIVLDGVIFMGSLVDINPNDIASYDILRDAVSAAAYGSRAANGIIAITTKRGSSAKPVITLNTSSGVQIWQNMPVMMKGEEWLKVVNDRNQWEEGSTNWLTQGEMANFQAGNETNWLDLSTQTGFIQDYQLAVSGAAKGLNYYLSTSYGDSKGVVIGDEFNRISILGKINTEITDWLKIGIDASYSRRDYSGFPAWLVTAQSLPPYGVNYRDDEGNFEKYPFTQSQVHPLWGVSDGTRENMDIRQSFRLSSYLTVDIPWIKGLNYRISFMPNLGIENRGNFYYENYYVAEGVGTERYAPSVVAGFLTRANGNLENRTTYSYVLDNIITYKNRFGKHNVEATLVTTRDFLNYEMINSTGSDFAANGNTTLGMSGLHKATTQKVELDAYERSNVGYLGRISYSLFDKYYLTSSFRRDGASVFGANKKWGNFAAAGVAWKISEEIFLDSFKSLDNLKLKLSWGQNGNQGIEPYTTLSRVVNGSTGGIRNQFSDKPGVIYYGLVQNSLGNDGLGWESTESWNTGFESAWLKNRLFADIDIYFSKTTDQIFQRNIPVMSGFKTIMTSMGQINNSGIELNLRSLIVKKRDFNWMTTLTYWKNNNKLVKLYGEDLDGDGKEDDDIANSLFIGKSLGAIYGYEQDGITQTDDSEYISQTGSAPGAPKYKDIDGAPGITATDRKILGYTKENFRMNIGNNLNYNDFELYVLVTGIFGGNNHYLQSNPRAYMTSGTGIYNSNIPYIPYWTPENRSNVYPSAYFSGDGRFLGLQSRGFVRIQDISLSYSFRHLWVKAANISSLKLFIAAKNVATFTNWNGGDPETGAGFLSNTFPVMAIYSIGAAISF